MYTAVNYKSKKALVEAVKRGDPVRIFAPGSGTPVTDGIETLEGPHYPEPHKWYARVKMENGLVKKVL